MSSYEGGGGGGGRGRRYEGTPTGGGGGGGCDSVDFTCALASPNAALLGQIKVDWTLQVESRPVANTKVAVVVVNGEALGTITAPEAVRLLECIDKGFSYWAQVLEIRGGLCRVRVRHST